MSKKLFKPIKIGSATAIIAITTFISYVIGLLRDRIIAVHFGTTQATDTYNASFLIPDTLFNLFIAGALSAAFLPIFSEYLVKDKTQANKIANTMITTSTLAIGILSLITLLFTRPIITFMFPEFGTNIQVDIINMTRMMLFSAILFSISNTLGNILMSYKHFLSFSISPILYNLGIILGIIFFNEQFGIYSAAAGVIIGAFLHCLIRIIDVFYTEYRFKPELDIRHPAFIKILHLMIPRSLGLIAWQINVYIFAKVGMGIVEGGLAAFQFARNIQSFAVSLFGVSFATAVFPFLTNAVTQKDEILFTEQIRKTIQRILFFTIPAAVGVMLLSREIIELILSGGVFDENSITMTSSLLFFFALSIPFESLTQILSRAYYAKQDTLTPTIINILGMAIIALITIFIAPNYGVYWFSIAFTTGFGFYVLINSIVLRKHLKDFKFKEFFISSSKTIISSLVMAIFLKFSVNLADFMPDKFSHLLRILVGAGVFFLTAIILRSTEIESVRYILDRILKKQSV